MSLFEWLKRGRAPKEDARLRAWKDEWMSAIAAHSTGSGQAPDADRVAALGTALDRLGLPEEEIEVEREMLDGLDRLAALMRQVDGGDLPAIETGHRVVGTERCHFSAPASMPEEPNQPGGRLLLTSGRAIFVGGTSARTLAWHTIGEALQNERDIILIRVDREHMYRFRSNSFADALGGTFLARRLLGSRRRVL